ncbi:NAD(+) synthase [Nitrosopumilus adriaticus]|uniref:NAD(+) synthase n=1 Tax=Nitrosopumilus adriaticus TaxID=1580092 RepID=UPI00352F729D
MEQKYEILQLKQVEKTIIELEKFLKEEIFQKFQKKGAIIGISGGIDSAVMAAICARSIDSNQILGIIMPEKESDPESQILAKKMANQFGIKTQTLDITSILDTFGVYNKKEKIVKRKFSSFNKNCKYRVTVPSKSTKYAGIPFLEILDDKNKIHQFKISSSEFLELTAASSIKHRVRMTMLYYFAEKNNFCVIGTTNKSEFLQGYFVKYGDGGTDIEPLTNLYKSQIYQIGEFLNIPNEILKKDASPDIWSFNTSDEEFFYSVPYHVVDLILYARENKLPKSEIQKISGFSIERIESLLQVQNQKQTKSQHMREIPHSWNNI